MNQAELQTLLDKQIQNGKIYNLVVGVQSKDGRLNLAGAAGTADAQSGTPMTVDTPYALASITKMYTAAVILRLHERGLLDLDEPISRYLPADLISGIHVFKGRDYSDQIRVYQLVNQTSGLSDYFLDKPRGGSSIFDELKQGHDLALDIQAITDLARCLPPKFEPGAQGGTRAHYADTNYRLLGAIIESVTGQPVTEVFEEMIFAPLGLKCTFLFDATPPPSDRVRAEIYLKDRAIHLPKFFSTNTTDGGMISTVGENLIFLRAFFDGKLFDPAFFDRMMQRWNRIFFPMQYGYGMMRVNLPRIFSPFRPFPEFIGHSGSTGSFAYYCPEKALYLAGTVNQIAVPSKPILLMMQIANAVA